MGAARKQRWTRAFAESAPTAANHGRRATIVLEHLMQASDVAHTMQHFQMYQKWNQRLYCEVYRAYSEGRQQPNPSEYWYQAELNFFESYILPLAHNLRECGVFGVSSDEYYQYAVRNQREWAAQGRHLIQEFHETALKLHGAASDDDNNKEEEEPDKSATVGGEEEDLEDQNEPGHAGFGVDTDTACHELQPISESVMEVHSQETTIGGEMV